MQDEQEIPTISPPIDKAMRLRRIKNAHERLIVISLDEELEREEDEDDSDL